MVMYILNGKTVTIVFKLFYNYELQSRYIHVHVAYIFLQWNGIKITFKSSKASSAKSPKTDSTCCVAKVLAQSLLDYSTLRRVQRVSVIQ